MCSAPLTAEVIWFQCDLPQQFIPHTNLQKNVIFWDYFKMFGRGVFEVTEVKGGCMVKEQDFEAEKNQNECKKIKYPTVI